MKRSGELQGDKTGVELTAIVPVMEVAPGSHRATKSSRLLPVTAMGVSISYDDSLKTIQQSRGTFSRCHISVIVSRVPSPAGWDLAPLDF